MFKNYIVTAFRNLLRNRTYTFINVVGLSLGIGAALVLFKYVLFEKSYDLHHSNYDNIYRFVKEEINANSTDKKSGVPNPFREAFQTDYPEFGIAARTFYSGDGQLSVKGLGDKFQHFQVEDGVAFVDNEVFKVFDFELVIGDKASALANPKTAVISESLAMKLFGVDRSRLDQVIGQPLRLDSELDLTITGVMADQPQNTVLPFTVMIEYEALDGFFDFFAKDNWNSTSSNAHLYLLKPDNIDVAQIAKVLPAFTEKHQGKEGAAGNKFHLQPYGDVHFQPEYGAYGDRVVASDFLVIPVIVGVFLILTACVNFINLATAQAVKRSKEVGIRKVLGGQKRQLALQFMGETFFVTLVSVLLALGLAELGLQSFPELIGSELSLNLLQDTQLLLLIGFVVVAVTLLAGTYPALILSSLKPALALKGKGQSAMAGKTTLRRVLVIFQFVISQVLVICTLVVISQMNYFQNADLGFRRTSIINFALPSNESEKVRLMKSEMMRNARVTHVSFAFSSPRSNSNISANFNYAPLASETSYEMSAKIIDEHFVPLYEIEMLSGRNLTAADTTFENGLVSESLIKIMNIEDPEEALGLTLESSLGTKKIVGVFKDFHSNSLKDQMSPLMMVNAPIYYYQGSVRFEGDESQTKDLVASIEKVWSSQYPDNIFDHTVYSQALEDDYEEEANMLDLFQLFSGIAIVIGCLGLYGLISFMANQKTKEIGVRKVLGASVSQILRLFTKELMVLIVISFLLAGPLGYWFMNGWLQDFEYSVSLNAWVFVVAVAFTLIVSGVTTGVRSFRAARANPVDSLRSE